MVTSIRNRVLSQAQQKYQNRTMPAKRGTIYDRNGNILATSNKVYNVVLDCKAVNSDEDYLDPTVNALVTIFGLDEGELRTRLTSDKTRESQYQIVKKQVSMDDKKAFEDYCSIPDDTEMTREEIQEKNNIQGVWFEEDYLRVYHIMSWPVIRWDLLFPEILRTMELRATTIAA